MNAVGIIHEQPNGCTTDLTIRDIYILTSRRVRRKFNKGETQIFIFMDKMSFQQLNDMAIRIIEELVTIEKKKKKKENNLKVKFNLDFQLKHKVSSKT